MKKITVLLIVVTVLFSCSKEDERRNDNPYLTSPIINLQLNLNLPEYTPLNYPGNFYIENNYGIRGIVIYNVDNSQYVAFELSDPNHVPNDCSRMEVEGIEATCPCDDDENAYNVITGQHLSQPDLYPMQRYRAERNGNVINITN